LEDFTKNYHPGKGELKICQKM